MAEGRGPGQPKMEVGAEKRAYCSKCLSNDIKWVWFGGELVLFHCPRCKTEFVATVKHARKLGFKIG